MGEAMKAKQKAEATETGIQRAIRLLGGVTKTALLCQVSGQAVHEWRRAGRVLRYAHAKTIAVATGLTVEQLLEVTPLPLHANGGTPRRTRPKRHAARALAPRAGGEDDAETRMGGKSLFPDLPGFPDRPFPL